MAKKIVIALGGNALGSNLKEQMIATKNASKAIVDLVEQGSEVVVTHGNGPQVGLIDEAMGEFSKLYKESLIPLSVCVAMSQGYIGCDLQNAIRRELNDRSIDKEVSTILTQVQVDEKDPAFRNPTKPIGKFMTKQQAEKYEQQGETIIEDSGRGYRRVVASPKPVDIIETQTIKTLIDKSQIVIAGGGGGIPVIKTGNELKGVNAVVDKDFVSAKIAKLINADFLIILTAVEKVAINYGKSNQLDLDKLSVRQARDYIKQDQFAKGSMLPKVEAAMEFVKTGKDREALITLLSKAKEAVEGKTGTHIINQ